MTGRSFYEYCMQDRPSDQGKTMTNTRKNALHDGIKEDHYNNVREALDKWVESGESYAVIQDQVEDIITNLQDSFL